MTELGPPRGLSEDLAAASELAGASHSPRTIRAYRSDVRAWTAWCQARGVRPLPVDPRVLSAYLATLATTHRASSIDRCLAALSYVQRAAGLPPFRSDVALQAVRRGIRRKLGTEQEGKSPLVLEQLQAICRRMPDWAARDRAILLLGWAGALRRSELCSLEVSDVTREARGLVLHLRRSKTDQEGAGRDVAIPYGSDPRTCPVRALDAWLARAGITEGPVFRAVDQWDRVSDRALGDRAVAKIVKRWCAELGLDVAGFAGHSLRAGLATSAAAAGKSERSIMAQTGHKSSAMVRRYIRRATLFDECAAVGIGL
jgi:integrase